MSDTSPSTPAAGSSASSAATAPTSSANPATLSKTDEPVTGDALAKAQQERDPETVGPVAGHSVRRLATSDEGDAHRDWTSQSGVPFPQEDVTTPTRFHPAELPNPDRALEAGFIPQVLPDSLVDADYVTQPPSMNVPVDHPLRDAYRPDEGDEGPKLNTNVLASYEAAKSQAAGPEADTVTKR